jgi:deoxyribose-phosphate aldolase
MSERAFAKLFDHSVVRPDATSDAVLHAAELAATLGTATLTVQPHYIRLAAHELQGTGVLVGSVVGFPHGNETPSMKQFQAREVVDLGAREIDMVMNVPALKNHEKGVFLRDIAVVVAAAAQTGSIVKVITENCLLTDDEKRRACEWITETGARFVKTSTAYAAGGATLDDVRLMHDAVAGRCLVKAAGGVRTIHDVLDFLRAGARRFGSTRTEQLVAAFVALDDEDRRAYDEFLAPLTARDYRLDAPLDGGRGGTAESSRM